MPHWHLATEGDYFFRWVRTTVPYMAMFKCLWYYKLGNNRTRTVRLCGPHAHRCGPHPHSSLKIVRTRTVTRTLTRPFFVKKLIYFLSICGGNFLFFC